MSQRQSITMEMPWIPGLSTNRAYYRNPHTGYHTVRPAVRQWQQQLKAMLLIECNRRELQLTPPVSIRIDQRCHRPIDQDNFKMVWDAIKEGIGIDDRHFVAEPGTWTTERSARASFRITISWPEIEKELT